MIETPEAQGLRGESVRLRAEALTQLQLVFGPVRFLATLGSQWILSKVVLDG
jgi:hypothetical protein